MNPSELGPFQSEDFLLRIQSPLILFQSALLLWVYLVCWSHLDFTLIVWISLEIHSLLSDIPTYGEQAFKPIISLLIIWVFSRRWNVSLSVSDSVNLGPLFPVLSWSKGSVDCIFSQNQLWIQWCFVSFSLISALTLVISCHPLYLGLIVLVFPNSWLASLSR